MTAVRTGLPTRGARSWSLAAFAALLAVGASSCDTVALIIFPDREFQQIQSSGFTATGGSCEGITDGTATLRFVLRADDGTPIRPGDVIQRNQVDLTASNVSFSQTALFESPREIDDPDTTMAPQSERICASTNDCRQTGMECTLAPGLTEAVHNRCLRTADVSTKGELKFVADTDKPQLFGVLFENSGSMEGFLPADVAALYPDWDGDGTAEGSTDTLRNTARGSDDTRSGRAALTGLISNWKEAARVATNEQRATHFGLWEFKGTSTADVDSLVAKVSPTGSVWTTSGDIAERSRTEFSPITGTRGNVYMAINNVLSEGFGASDFDGFEKTLVVVVDGPDDLRLPQHSADSVIQRAQEQGVRLFIVHLDAKQSLTSTGNAPLHRDHPLYWNETVDGSKIQQACTTDAQCNNFERCRVPTSYADTAGASVVTSPNGESYCMPTRDPVDGRFGPIHDYSKIACATEGGYIYVQHPSGIRPRTDWLPFAMDGLWEVNTVVDALENRTVLPEEGYRMQTTMSVTVEGTQRSYNFSQVGLPVATDDGRDTRAVLFNGSAN